MAKKANITVIGFPQILSSAQEVAEEYLGEANFLYYQYMPEVRGVKYINCSPEHPLLESARIFSRVSHDIVVVGVVTAKALEGVNKNSIIPFRVGHKALINAFLKAKKIADKAAFICPIEEKHDMRFFEELTGLKIDIYYTDTLRDYRRYCKEARLRGHSVVISGSYTFQIAKDYGLTPVFLFSDHDIFHDAYSRALETHRYNQSLEEKLAQLEIITQSSEESVIFVDKRRKITFTSKVAEEKLQIGQEKISGQPVSKLFNFITPELLNQKENTEVLGALDKEPVLVTIHPVVVGPENVGSVLIAKKVNEIRAMDNRIRQKMRYKGFTAKYTFDDILGNSPAVQESKEKAVLYAASDAPVLVYGATGTGKELFAQAIHNASSRKIYPFVAINCATLPSELMESELFGYVKGAFTGASSRGKQGLVDQAHLGTLFFDEVDSLPIKLQAKLLRLLQEKEFIRVGGDEVIPVDIRIIAACNKKQNKDPEKNPLRQDLFYRLSTLYLQLPSLLQRKSDIPHLFIHFLEEYDKDLAKQVVPFSQLLSSILSELAFPGNLRELQSIAARFSCLCDQGRLASHGYFSGLLESCCHTNIESDEVLSSEVAEETEPGASFAEVMKNAERALLQRAVEENGGAMRVMAEQLGLGRTTLWRKLKEHNLN